ncbi:MAG: hypothetical protein ACRC6I_02050, partial [Paracoccaceae bacterium]
MHDMLAIAARARRENLIFGSIGMTGMQAKVFSGMVLCLFAGWVLGSAVPIELWPHSLCHRMGGSVQV